MKKIINNSNDVVKEMLQGMEKASPQIRYIKEHDVIVRTNKADKVAILSGGGSGPKNYIPELQPGESVTIRFAWLVNEDELDKLYLNLNGNLVFTEKGLEIGFVDLNL